MKRRAFLASFWTFAILFLCWLPKPYVPEGERLPPRYFIPHLDKIVHMAIFAVFAFLWMRVGQTHHRVRWVFLAGLALATITELGQNNQIVRRDGNVVDGLADLLGVVVGLMGYFLVQRIWVKREAQIEV
jgi:uncharacterized membrane protein YccC